MKAVRPGRAKGSCVVRCRCGRRLAGKPGTVVTCAGCNRSQTIVRSSAPRKKVQMYL
jgi:hypothetical protein